MGICLLCFCVVRYYGTINNTFTYSSNNAYCYFYAFNCTLLTITVALPARAPLVLSAEETADEGTPVRLRCYLPGSRGAELHWRREDGNPLGKDATDEQGILTIPRASVSDAGAYISSAMEPSSSAPLHSQPARIIVNAVKSQYASLFTVPTPTVEVSSESVGEGQPVRLQCHVPGRPDVQLHWRREDGSPLSAIATDQRGILTIMRTEPSDSGAYICSSGEPGDEDAVEYAPVYLTVTPNAPTLFCTLQCVFAAERPLLVSAEETVNEGEMVRLRCYLPGRDDTELHWRREDASAINEDAIDEHGILTISRAKPSDAGYYICSADDPHGGGPLDSSSARIIINAITRMFVPQ
ncbi:unnamed protein product [Toxocara canis]|uniref:Basement membrane proteoglycan n=1 Tax=Toxocara canis TaxID=6265 RepID=A0A183VFX5_TOXCA|nr:unnamed protein product [Toxocara canis]